MEELTTWGNAVRGPGIHTKGKDRNMACGIFFCLQGK